MPKKFIWRVDSIESPSATAEAVERPALPEPPSPILDPLYFPRCEFYSRSGSVFSREGLSHANTYSRSTKKRNHAKGKKTFSSIPGRDGDPAKEGTYYNMLGFFPKETFRIRSKPPASRVAPATFYDRLLQFQVLNARTIVTEVRRKAKEKELHVIIHSANNYPAVMICIPEDMGFTYEYHKKIKPIYWTNFTMLYLAGFINYYAQERGVNIEMVFRSSFGTLGPSIAECKEMVRISPGLVPKDYLNIVVDAIIAVATLFDSIKIRPKAKQLQRRLNAIYSHYYDGSFTFPNNAFDILFSRGDSKKKSVIYQLFRTHVNTQRIAAAIHAQLEACGGKLSAENWLLPFHEAILNCKLNGGSVSYKPLDTSVPPIIWNPACVVEDTAFWTLVREFGLQIEMKEDLLEALIQSKKTERLHDYFYQGLKDFNFNIMPATDGYGSDSEDESSSPTQKIYGLKLITATGMRAIMLAEYAARKYLFETFDYNPDKPTHDCSRMYYETEIALRKHNLPLVISKPIDLPKKKGVLHLIDLNYCNTNRDPFYIKLIDDNLFAHALSVPVVILDVTSTPTDQIARVVEKLLYEHKLEAVLTVSSGLKNEQGMSDYNHYGTIRIFTVDKNDGKRLRDYMIEQEEIVNYKHPAASHGMRKANKAAGMTPTNRSIFAHMNKAVDEEGVAAVTSGLGRMKM